MCKLDFINTGKGCNSMCNGHGYCVSGQCFCDVAWRGSLCEVQSCPGQYDDCSLHGSCNSATQVCTCNPGKTTTCIYIVTCTLYSIPLICLKYCNFMHYVICWQRILLKLPFLRICNNAKWCLNIYCCYTNSDSVKMWLNDTSET